MAKKVTVRDIAKVTGLSPSTVSRVLRGEGYISEETIKKVLNAAEETGYFSHKTRTARDKSLIGFLMPKMNNTFNTELMDGILATAAQNGYSVIMGLSRFDNTFYVPPPFLRQNRLTGLIITGQFDCVVGPNRYIDSNVPVVQCSEYDEKLPFPFVSLDDYAASYNVVQYLHSTGRKKIGLLNMSLNKQCGRKREEGYRSAMKDLGLAVSPEWVHHLNLFDFNLALNSATILLSGKNPPDAIFAAADLYALATLRAALRLGYSVPKDLSIVGFDDSSYSLMCDPPLTSVHQPAFEIGSTACSTLIGMIEGTNKKPRSYLFNSELIVRGST